MEPPRRRRYLDRMTNRITVIAAIVLAAFGSFSLWVVWTEGYFGFLRSAGRDMWSLQMLLDVAISSTFVIGWMVRDAKSRKIASWPYVIATVFLGSLGALAYLVTRRRET
jgi:hypothetical protein